MGVLLKSQYQLKNANKTDRLARLSSPFVPYIGPYIATVFGANYVGDSIRNQGELLTTLKEKNNEGEITDLNSPYKHLNSTTDLLTKLRTPINQKPQFTKSDVKKGYFYRYFFLDNRTQTFIESNKTEFNKISQIDTIIYSGHKFRWYFNQLGINLNTTKFLKKLGSINISAYEFNGITNID